MIKPSRILFTVAIAFLFCLIIGKAQDAGHTSSDKSSTYILAPNDVVQIKVYQEDDLETQARIGQDGTISFPLIGVVAIGGKTVEEADDLIRKKLDKDYLVNPQVTLIVSEYSKRRFTVLGQVQKPGSYEIPSEESVTLLEAIAMAGGYTRLADKSRIKITRMKQGKAASLTVNSQRTSNDSETLSFQIIPDDTVVVPERFF